MKRGSISSKKIAIPNRTKEELELIVTTENPDYCSLSSDVVKIRPDCINIFV